MIYKKSRQEAKLHKICIEHLLQVYINIFTNKMPLLPLNTRNLCLIINYRLNISFVRYSTCGAHV